MKKRISQFLVLMFLSSCSSDDTKQNVCIDGTCFGEFYIDTLGHPGTYKDADGVWHIKHAGLNYFTVKGNLSNLDPHYVINGVPLVTTAFDSNLFYTLGNVIWTYPVYSYLGLWSSNQMNTPIPVGTQTYTFPQLVQQTTIENLVGYEIQHNPNVNVNHPAYQTYFSTYSRYTYSPQQSMVFFTDFIGMSATIYIQISFGENKEVVNKELKVVFEN
ncbi:hypothetical protein [Flavobacterium sp.]|uniref:hypothetical protein n=1 Tax=Flavobacterium sp. TaxID=239 RepID=UPI0026326F17|nr:hypothetical protein [Flavobacterium sp.]